jgi:opacity protein-like surface antigen
MLTHKTLHVAGMAALLVAVSAGTAAAADMLSAPPPPPVPVASAISADSGFYLRGDVGYGMHTYDKLDYDPKVAGTTYSYSADSLRGAISTGVGVGYQVNSWLRADITGEYRSIAPYRFHERMTSGATTWNNHASGNVSAVVGLVNGYVDLGTWNRLTPFVGVGVGIRHVTISDAKDVAPTGAGSGSDGFAARKSSSGLVWALHAGAAYDLGGNWKAELGYRYLHMGTVKSATFSCRAGGTSTYIYGCAGIGSPYHARISGLGSHDVRFGLRYMFADNTPAPVYAPGPLVRKY